LLRKLHDAGLPPPVKQHRVRLLGGKEVRLDLAWPRDMTAIEYDGARWHGPRRLEADVVREEALRALGWWIARADRSDLAPSSTRVVDLLRPRLSHHRAA
jgi:very-short-patch-repair endonuclease